MNERTEALRQSWDSRQSELGSSQRSVLFRGLPGWINARIHRQHIDFISNCLGGAEGRLLDLGCGYGRISAALISQNPGLQIEGVELCTAFADQFRAEIGPCANLPVQEFEPSGEYDFIITVTCLQYVEPELLPQLLLRYWRHLRPGGKLVSIEQYENVFVTARKRGMVNAMQPTGGDITYFQRGELRELVCGLPDARLEREANITGLPLGFPVMHSAVSVCRDPA